LPAYLAVASVSSALFAHAAAAPELREVLGLSLTELGVLLSAVVAGSALAQPFAGPIYGRLGPDRALGCGLAAFTAVSLLVAAQSDWRPLLLGRVLQGLVGGSLFVTGTAYVALHATPGQARLHQAWYGAVVSAASALTFALAPPALALLGWRGSYALPL